MNAKIQNQMNMVDRQPLQNLAPLATPFVIYFDPSSVCNFKCNFCFHRTDGGGQ